MGEVIVWRIGADGEWRVLFVYVLNGGDVPELSVHVSELTCEGAGALVTELLGGSNAMGSALKLPFDAPPDNGGARSTTRRLSSTARSRRRWR